MPNSRINYVFLNDSNCMGCAQLIKISNYSNKRLQDLKFCMDIIVHPRNKMCNLLRAMKFPSTVNDETEMKRLTKKLTEIVADKLDSMFVKEDYHVFATEAMLQVKLKKMINNIRTQ